MSVSEIEQQIGAKRPGHRKTIYGAVLVILVVALFLAMSSVAFAAVAPDGAATTNVGTGASVTVSHTTGATANLMLVGVAWNCGTAASENETIASVTLGGTPLTLLQTKQAPDNGSNPSYRYVALYYLLNPTSGAGTVTVTFQNAGGGTWDNSVDGGIVVGVSTFTGVNSTSAATAFGPVANGSGGTPSSGGGATGTINVAAAVGDLVFDTVFKGGQTGNNWDPDATQTPLWNVKETSAYVRGGASTKTAAATSVPMTWTGTENGYWMAIGVALKPATSTPVAPVITSDGAGATASVNAAENQTAVTDVNATDANGDTLTYSISGGADQAKFSINATTGVLTFLSAPDFETPTDAGANNVYDVTVQVSDGSLTDTQAIAVTVTDVAEGGNVAPEITSNGGGATAAVNAAENQTAVTDVNATDANAGDTLTYSLSGGADQAKFSINSSTGVLTFVTAPDREAPTDVGANNVYEVTVQVSDGALADTQAISVTVTNVNDVAPQIVSNGGGATASVSVPENTITVTDVNSEDADSPSFTYSLVGGADQAKFTIGASTGFLDFITAPDYENPTDVGANNVYDVIVQVSDGSLTDTQTISVTVTDVAEGGNVAPVITSNGGGATASVNAPENQTAVTDVNATDANAGDTLTYSLSGGADQAKFAIVPATGVLTFLSAPDYETPTDVGANNVYDVIVQVSDGSLTDTQAISVTVTDVADGTPTPVLTFTSPTGLGSYTSAQSFTASWSADIDLDVGQFGIWARSAGGSWYVGQLAPTGAGDDLLTYSATVDLTGVPAGYYQVIVGYRPTVGSGTFVSWATSYGFVFEVGDVVTPVVDITQPTGQASYTSAQSFTATWTASPSLTTGQFAVWVRSPGNTWYWKAPLVAATGAGSYSATVSLSGVAPGLGYQVIVAYEPIANTSLWSSWATSPGVFSVDATAPTVTITQPSGIASYTSAQSVLASWTTNQTLSGGEFGLWVRSGAGGWYVTTLVPATGSAGTPYSTSLPLSSVPAGSGNQVIISYRPVVGTGAFMSWATSPGSFTVTP